MEDRTRNLYYQLPHILVKPEYKDNFLNIMAFTGNAPEKQATGGKVTTYEDFIHFSDLDYKENIVLHFPGIKQGYHFKFSFPRLVTPRSVVRRIEVHINNTNAGSLELLEDMGMVAKNTFRSHMDLIYLKTIIRTVVKGLASEKAKEKLRDEAGVEKNLLLGALLNLGVDAAVDATENPDLRSWRTMPQKCYIGEYKLEPGVYDIDIIFYSILIC